MRLEHIALYTRQLEVLRDFYMKYFEATSNEKYINPAKGFESYFLSFADGARLEIMQKQSIPEYAGESGGEYTGLTHLAMQTGTKEAVDSLTEQLRADGYRVVGEPRTTGDGYYESVVLDPDGNRIEITA
ncbi:VOC family protein [Telluribacter humicola]|uniref:VOC family protein n=1 Tax=Telluribacter humicola TaxID=1720261 RepID=UPI001A972490|nr:VOC family protein [Telluribacter humicola]